MISDAFLPGQFKRVKDLGTFASHRFIFAIRLSGRWVRAMDEDIRRLV
jgi:hypothetical protein